MNAVEPRHLHDGASLVIFAKNQPQYNQLPASVDANSTVMTEWELSAEDLARLVNGGRIRLWLRHTGVANGVPLTPIRMETTD